MAEEKKGEKKEGEKLEPHCGRCTHVKVCLIFRNANILIRDNFLGIKPEPFKAYDMAKICEWFTESTESK